MPPFGFAPGMFTRAGTGAAPGLAIEASTSSRCARGDAVALVAGAEAARSRFVTFSRIARAQQLALAGRVVGGLDRRPVDRAVVAAAAVS